MREAAVLISSDVQVCSLQSLYSPKLAKGSWTLSQFEVPHWSR